MINGRRCLGVITARSGSKRLPNKNMLSIAGKPLIEWTIDAGIAANSIDKLIVSTNDVKIAELAEDCGIEIPFIRPAFLASDNSTSYSVLKHAFDFMLNRGENYDYIVLLQPTSPLRTSNHIDEAANLLEMKMADGVISVTEMNHPVEWSGSLSPSMEMGDFITSSFINTQSQLFKKTYCINGAIFITKTERMLKENNHIYGKSMYAYLMGPRESIDIDTDIDFELAEFYLKKKLNI